MSDANGIRDSKAAWVKYGSAGLVAALVVIGSAVCASGHIRIGASILGAAPVASAILRIRFHSKLIPWLVSRSAVFDITVGLAMGLAVWTVAWIVPQ